MRRASAYVEGCQGKSNTTSPSSVHYCKVILDTAARNSLRYLQYDIWECWTKCRKNLKKIPKHISQLLSEIPKNRLGVPYLILMESAVSLLNADILFGESFPVEWMLVGSSDRHWWPRHLFNISPPRAVIVHSSQPSHPASTGLLLSLPGYMFTKRTRWFSLEISYLVNGFKSKTIHLLYNTLCVTIVYLSYCVIFLAGMSQTVRVWSRFSQNHNVHNFDIWIAVSVFPCFEDFCYIFYFALIKQIN